jgi:hypothetical protein
MKSRIGFLQKSLMVTGLILLLLGCAPEAASAPSPTNAEDETPEAVTATEVTRSSTETTTATASPTSTPNPPLTSAPTTTVMPVVTPTLIPTLAPEQAASVIHDLFEDNGGCLLPCFWGFTPGQTEWQSIQRVVAPIALQIFLQDTYAEVNLPAPETVHLIELRQFYVFEDDIITQFVSPVIQTLSYQPSTILSTYGQPDEVWLATANAPREGHWGLLMNLFYSRQSFMLQYSVEATQQNDMVRGCGFEQDDLVLLSAWLPGEELDFKTASGRSPGFAQTEFALTLEEATGMTLETFYETFKDPDNPICLESPINLWPDP